ncbi:hypothetical protein TNCT_711371 [Trichonephila clavata]|uniref:Uncharacterized protein n=1 Tax=Trichonephila clavata TaxID=2740835 RepID=A0A8X6I161_TRICU|nr:hypothetical protein TNCT_711371 [Trichonephila clavata]
MIEEDKEDVPDFYHFEVIDSRMFHLSLMHLFLMKYQTEQMGAASTKSMRSLFGHHGCKPRVSCAAWKTYFQSIDKDAGLGKSYSPNHRKTSARNIILRSLA